MISVLLGSCHYVYPTSTIIIIIYVLHIKCLYHCIKNKFCDLAALTILIESVLIEYYSKNAD